MTPPRMQRSGPQLAVDELPAEEKTERLRRLKTASPLQREHPRDERGQRKPDPAFVGALDKIRRLCSMSFSDAVAAGRVLPSREEVLAFAALPDQLIGQADLAGVHDAETLTEFLRKANAGKLPMSDSEAQRRAQGKWQEGGRK